MKQKIGVPVPPLHHVEFELDFIRGLIRKNDYGDIDIPAALLHVMQLVVEHDFIIEVSER